ncbi:MAG: LamG domain-containing protein [Hylemonella sp.]
MSTLRFAKVDGSLPAQLQPHTVYMVRSGNGFDLYCSDASGTLAYPINPPAGGPVSGGGGDDPYFSSTSLLMRCNGSDNSTLFLDESANPKAIQAFDNARIRTTVSKYGGASAFFDGSGDYLQLSSNTDFDLGSTYTIELWVYPLTLTNNSGLLHRGFYSTSTNIWDNFSFSIRMLGANMRCYFWATSNANEQRVDVSGALVTNLWQHIAMVRDGGVGRVYIDGVLKGSVSGLNAPLSSNRPLKIGLWDYSAGNEWFNGYMDDIRITKGVARYSSNFTPPGPL